MTYPKYYNNKLQKNCYGVEHLPAVKDFRMPPYCNTTL